MTEELVDILQKRFEELNELQPPLNAKYKDGSYIHAEVRAQFYGYLQYAATQELDQSKLYYESHITIEPVFDEYRSFAAGIAETYNFKLADLLMKKRSTDTETRSDKDTFMTGHSKSRKDIEKRTRDLVVALQKEGFKVWRYKIEDTLMDSRSEDVWGLLEDNDEN